jgi:hypothetical protein
MRDISASSATASKFAPTILSVLTRTSAILIFLLLHHKSGCVVPQQKCFTLGWASFGFAS